MLKTTVQPNDTLPKIALRYKRRDGGEAIWNANTELQKKANGNRYVLLPGWAINIPELNDKQASKPADQTGVQQVSSIKVNLSLTLLNERGEPLPDGWTCMFKQQGWVGASEPQVITGGKVVIPAINVDASEATLLLSDDAISNKCQAPRKIQLTIGGLEPFSKNKQQQIKAVRKVLTNLGLYADVLDGSFGLKTKRAVVSFEREYLNANIGVSDIGKVKITNLLLHKLQEAQGFTFGMERVPNADADNNDENEASTPDKLTHLVTDTTAWLCSVQEAHTGVPTCPIKPPPRIEFPKTAYVAPCKAGEESNQSNHVRMKRPWFVCLDKFLEIDEQLKQLEFRYWLGAKATDVTVAPEDIERCFSPGYEHHYGKHADVDYPDDNLIDCSGYARYIMMQSSETDIGDGTSAQESWCRSQGFDTINYKKDYTNNQNYLLINFMPGEHVWFAYMGQTYESHSPNRPMTTYKDGGVNSRVWNAHILAGPNTHVVSFVLPSANCK